MDWKDLGSIVGPIAPTLGSILGGLIPVPGGSMLGEWAGKQVASALGVPATPEAVNNAIVNGDPAVVQAQLAPIENEAIARWRAEADIARAQAEVGKAQVESINETIRAEAAKVDGWWGNWRILLAWSLFAETLLWPPFLMYLIGWKSGTAELIQVSGIITTWWGARFGLLGVHVWTGSNERQTAITGQPVKGLVANVASALVKKAK
ncbi:MAG TPA: hypothetical protein VNZ94_00540 [Xanthobacteraceae bacterium]|nr:hypothetical protein [Xanthobacteraceae bacterium]